MVSDRTHILLPRLFVPGADLGNLAARLPFKLGAHIAPPMLDQSFHPLAINNIRYEFEYRITRLWVKTAVRVFEFVTNLTDCLTIGGSYLSRSLGRGVPVGAVQYVDVEKMLNGSIVGDVKMLDWFGHFHMHSIPSSGSINIGSPA